MNYYFLLIPPLGLAVFVGFWCLVVKMVAMGGWQRLVPHFRVASLPPGRLFRLAQASVGGIGYRGAVRAGASPAGLALATGFPFGVGHPPLLIPWSALGPVQAKTVLWLTLYETSIQTPTGSVALSFASQDLIDAARPWLRGAAAD